MERKQFYTWEDTFKHLARKLIDNYFEYDEVEEFNNEVYFVNDVTLKKSIHYYPVGFHFNSVHVDETECTFINNPEEPDEIIFSIKNNLSLDLDK